MTTFVVCTGRCGSTSLCQWLQRYGDASMEPFARELIVESVKKPVTGKPSPAAVKLLTDIVRLCKNRTVVDNNLSLFVEDLAEIGPCRFVWLIRNPWDCISSLMAWKWYRDPDDIDENDVFAQNRLDAFRAGDEVRDVWPQHWTSWTKLQKCAWYWRWLNLQIEQQLSRLPEDHWIRVRLEDWSPATAKAVLRFVSGDDVVKDASLPRTNEGRWDDERPKWTEDEVSQVESVAGTALWRWYPEAHFKSPLFLAKWKAKEAEKALRAG